MASNITTLVQATAAAAPSVEASSIILMVLQQQGLMMLITWSFAFLLYTKTGFSRGSGGYLTGLLLLTATGALVANPLNVLTGKRLSTTSARFLMFK